MRPVTDKTWVAREADPAVLRHLEGAGTAPLLARLLANRGLSDPEAVGSFLNPALSALPDPYLMAGMDRAVERLAQAYHRGELVLIHGDYDVDGVSSVALLLSFFSAIGLDCSYYIPKRLTEGYGLSDQGVAAAREQGARVMVTVDCGIGAVEEAKLCREAGIDLVITDHHAPPDLLPEACALVNPLLPGCSYPFKSLAGVGVAFNLALALRSRLRADGVFRERREPDLRNCLDLVALGTVADVVPLLGVNRIMVSYGLKELSQSRRVGVQALKEVAGVAGEVSCGQVGFRLAPRLNAAGRLEDAALGLELLLSADPARAQAMARELDDANAERQSLERATLEEARVMLASGACRGRKSIVLASDRWHPGVIGIVASRIVELFHRPVILFALEDGTGRGSGRSISRFHLLDAVKECADHLLRFGGHSHAAGLSIAQAELERFAVRFEEEAARTLDAEALTPRLLYDAELSPSRIDADLPGVLETLRPFGMGNPEPLFLLRNAAVSGSRVLKGGHLKLQLSCQGKSFDAVGFGLAERELPPRVDLIFAPSLNTWNGKTSLQLMVKDLREAESC